MSDNSNTELVVKQEGPAVQVIMNRPEALNALSLEMIRIFSAHLAEWRDDAKVKAVFISGAGDKAFCAGGDIKSTYRTGMSYRQGDADERVISLFYGEEYKLNRELFHCEKPLFAFMDGITMGGGFGIAGPCAYRIACENTVFAMPEVGIGFFPDVGSMYFLNRTPGETGAYMALTGSNIGPEDMLYCGLATHYIPQARHGECMERLTTVTGEGGGAAEIDSVLSAFHESPAIEGDLQKNQALIDECFKGGRVESILTALKGQSAPWASQQIGIIESRSPVSLKVSLAHLRMAKDMDFDGVTAQDFILAQHFMQGHDFYEGVRAALINKDRQPQWDPAALEDITPAMVQDYFRPASLDLDEIAA